MASPGGVEVGRISVRVVPDTSHIGTDLKLALDRIEAQTDLKISTSIDTTLLDEQAKAAVDQAQVAAGNIHVKTEVDSSQLREATTASQGLASGLSGIATAAIVLGPALIPLVAVLGGLAAALAAPAVLAAGGLTLFGFITGAAIKQTEAQNKKLVALKTAVDSAKQSLANAQASASTTAANSLSSAQASAAASLKSAQSALANAKTTASVSSAAARIQAAHASLSARTSAIQASQSATVGAAQRRVTDATLAYQAALKGMTPAQLKFIQAQDALKSAFHNLLATVGSSVLGPVTKTLQLLTTVMPKVKPILVSFAGVFDGFLSSAGDAAKSKGFSDLVHLIANQGSRAFKTFTGILGNVFLAFGRLGRALLPFGNSVLAGLSKAAKGFADFAKSAKAKSDIKGLIDYIKTNGPKVGQALGDVAVALGAIVVAAAPIGTAVLGAIDGLAKGISKIPTADLTTLLVSLVALTVASKALGPFKALLGAIGLSNPEILLVVAGIALLTVGFIALYRNSAPLRNVLADLGTFFKDTLLPVIKLAAGFVGVQLAGAFRDISKSIKENKPFLEALGKALLIVVSGVVISGLLFIAANIRIIGKVIAVGIPIVHAWADLWLISIAFVVRAVGLLQLAVLNSFGHIIDAAASTFGWLPHIGGQIDKAATRFHAFADGVSQNFNDATKAIDDFRHSLDLAVKPLKPIKLTFDDQTTGPGGGIHRPGPVFAPNGGSTGGRPGGGPAPRSAPLVNVEHMDTTGVDDIMRKSGKLYRARSGGGVILVGAS